jgi:tetratricopeptide (TPR) repeat protein
MLTYKRRAIDIRDVAQELGARYVLEGSVRKSLTRMRIAAQLIEATSGHHVWAGHIDSPPNKVLEVEDEASRSIVASVQTQLILHEGRAVVRDGAHDRVERLITRSWQQLLRLTSESLAESRALAERALQLDGGSGIAHRMLSVALYHQAVMGFIPWAEDIVGEIHAHAKIAVESEDADEYSHWAMECAELLRGKHERAMASLQRAFAINPNCSLVHGSMGTVLAWAGQSDLSIEKNELALRINPDDPTNFFRYFGMALAHYLAGRYENAVSHANTVLQMSPSWWLGHLVCAASLAQVGRLDEARQVYLDLERNRPGLSSDALAMLPFAKMGDRMHLLDGLRKAGLQA